MDIKLLHRQGYSLRQIARALGISRNTIKVHLHYDGPWPRVYQRQARPATKLEIYKAYLEERVKHAQPHRLPAPVLLREIRERGYTGGVTMLRGYLRGLYPSLPDVPVRRFETAAGLQMQVDWTVFQRKPEPLSAFVATLGYSRASYVEFVNNEQLATLLACHEAAFTWFGGVPTNVLYDNMKTVVLDRNAYGDGEHRYQPGFLDFAHHCGFRPRLCRPYRAQTKGKVERFNHYLKHSFYFPFVTQRVAEGNAVDLEGLNSEVRTWLRDVADPRIHGTTGESPAQRMVQERLALQPLPPPYMGQVAPVTSAHQVMLTATAPLQRPLADYDRWLEGKV